MTAPNAIAGRTAVVLGVPVDDVTMPEAVERICAFVEQGRRTRRTHQVATVNADFVVNTLDDPEVLAVLQHSDLSIPDGMPVVWGSRLLGVPLRERVTGVDLLPALVAAAESRGYSLHLFGAGPGVADRAAEVLRSRHPAATITSETGPALGPDLDMEPGALEAVRTRRADILCVALGNPKQEWWISRYREEVGTPVFIGVGGTFDLLVGEKRRAPTWVGRIGMEWVFRAVQEPRRLIKRYAHDIATFLPRLARQAWVMRSARAGRWQPSEVSATAAATVLRPRGRLAAADLESSPVAAAISARGRVVVDLSALSFLDNVSASNLAHLARSAWHTGAEVYVAGVGAEAERCLTRLRLNEFLPRWPTTADAVYPSPTGEGS